MVAQPIEPWQTLDASNTPGEPGESMSTYWIDALEVAEPTSKNRSEKLETVTDPARPRGVVEVRVQVTPPSVLAHDT
jgi:hypothetical protein